MCSGPNVDVKQERREEKKGKVSKEVINDYVCYCMSDPQSLVNSEHVQVKKKFSLESCKVFHIQNLQVRFAHKKNTKKIMTNEKEKKKKKKKKAVGISTNTRRLAPLPFPLLQECEF
jgi:hypothetical protein